MSLATRSINSARWNVAVSTLQVVIGVVRFVMLSRLLDVDLFGVYAFATAVVGISILVIELGLNEAFLHRHATTENEQQALSVLFALRLTLTVLWLGGMLLWAFNFTSGESHLAFVVIILAHAVNHPLMHTAMALLTRRVVHRRLALRQLVSTFVGTVVSLWLAWQGAGLWALLATDIVNAVATVVVLYGWRPVWIPRLQWIPDTVRYYLSFGGRSFLATFILRTMDEIDDIWIYYNLGKDPLGLYARAYQFAIYPRQILAVPLSSVADGTYSALKGNRAKLSETFVRTNSLIIRSGFLLAGTLAITAPELVPVLLDAKFAPMVLTFQLMLIFALLDPLRSTIANLFMAVGQPERVIRARVVQFVVLVVGLLTLGPLWGIEGVAVAVDSMLFVGIAILLWQARNVVDYSLVRLFGIPLLGLLLGVAVAYGGLQVAGAGAWWWTGGIKLVLFSSVYVGLLLLFEYRELVELRQIILNRRSS
jgi:O-antigen/teichoic acid export membrane protein